MIPKLEDYKKRWQIESEQLIKPGLEAIQEALHRVGNPEQDLQVIHVAGTNGKGSTIAFMEEILRAHGYSTGVFSSPAIRDIHDQIQFNREEIEVETLDYCFQVMSEAGLSGMLTDFELLTVAAFIAFKNQNLDFVLIETGMGGRLDSTNVVDPIVSVITSIALDHTKFLGNTISSIAEEKSGIIKKGRPIVVGELLEDALSVVREKARKENSKIHIYGEHFFLEERLFRGHQTFSLGEQKLKGHHQQINAAIAIEALLAVNIQLSEQNVKEAISNTYIPFRFEEVYKNVFFDGAHNPAAAKALRETIQQQFPGEKVDFIIGMLKGKDIQLTLDELCHVASSFTFISFPHPEAATIDELINNCNCRTKIMTNECFNTIILSNGLCNKTIVTGSLYLINSLLNYRRNNLLRTYP